MNKTQLFAFAVGASLLGFGIYKIHKNTAATKEHAMETKAYAAATKEHAMETKAHAAATKEHTMMVKESIVVTKENTLVTAEVQDSLQAMQFIVRIAQRVSGICWRGW